METKRTIREAAVASMLLVAVGGAFAQTIYKQVDEEGRVIFTDQPAPGARTVTSFEIRARASAPVEPAASEAPARVNTDQSARRAANNEALRRTAAPGIESTRRMAAEIPAGMTPAAPRMGDIATPKRTTEVAAASVQTQYPAVSRGGYADAERAAVTYTALNTPLAAQADATEAARRARQEANKAVGGAVLVVQAAPRDHVPASKKSGIDSFYLIWAATFLALAAGLLYVGWQVIRLILGTAFPRWQVGLG